MRRTGQMLAVLGVIAVWAAAAGATGPTGEQPVPSATQLDIPHSPQEHVTRADYYKKKAAEYRADADVHHKMFAGYHQKNPDSPMYDGEGREILAGTETALVTKMRKHCDDYIRAAEQLAAEADRFAEFHRMRAAEMRGK